MSPDRQRRSLTAFFVRHRVMLAMAIVLTFTTAGTAAAVSYLVLGTVNTAAATTTLKSGVNGPVLKVTNTNPTGGTSAAGVAINVPAGRAPMTVNSSVKVTNLNADKLDGLESSALARRTQPAWRVVGGPGEVPFGKCDQLFNDPWLNYGGSTYNTVAFYMDTIGNVHLRGLAKCWPDSASSAGRTIFTLPLGYRPAAVELRATLVENGLGRIDVTPAGEVVIVLPTDHQLWHNYVLLDGITFRPGP